MKIMSVVCFFAVAFLSGCRSAGKSACSFTYASWNIGHFSLGKSHESTITSENAKTSGKAYLEFLSEVGADVLGVCEYSDDFVKGGSAKAGECVFSSYPTSRIGPANQYQWNAQFYRIGQIKATAVKAYSKHVQNVYYIVSRVLIDGEEVVFVQTHLDWGTMYKGHEDDRASQMRELIADFQNERHVVISGDFNVGIRVKGSKMMDNPGEYKLFELAGFTLGTDGHYKTAPAGDCWATLDNIIVKGLKISNFRVWDRPDLSDHALISATLTLK